jgi:hypothetical protein
MANFLNQPLAAFAGNSLATPQYLYPTKQNLQAGSYDSEIQDVREVLSSDGSLDALDFYHILSDANGRVLHIRFRYYEKELPALASVFCKYSCIGNWSGAVGLCETVDVSPKATGQYMRISGRSLIKPPTASTLSQAPSGVSTSCAGSPPKKGVSLSKKHKTLEKSSSLASRNALLEDDEDDDDYDFLDDED